MAQYTSPTGNPCPDIEFYTVDITDHTAEFTFDNWEDYDRAIVYIKKFDGQEPYTGVEVTGDSFLYNTLEPKTRYKLEIEAYCELTDDSPQGKSTAEYVFETLECLPPRLLDYDLTSSTTATFTWESENAGAVYDFQIQEEASAFPPSVYNGITPPQPFTGLVENITYEWAVRADCGFAQSEWVEATMKTNYCPPPASISVTGVTDVSATLNWVPPAAAADVTGYICQIIQAGEDPMVFLVDEATTSLPVPDLISGETYEVYVESECDAIESTSVMLNTAFTTTGCSLDDLLITDITSYSARVNYDNLPAGSQIAIQYRKAGTGFWIESYFDADPPSVASRTFSVLEPGTTYEVEIQLTCATTVGAPQTFLFTTLACPIIENLEIVHEAPAPTTLTTKAQWDYSGGEPDALQILLVNLSTGLPEVIQYGESTAVPFFVFNNLGVGDLYQLSINSICAGTLTAGPVVTFTAPNPATLRAVVEEEENPLAVYPNPAQHYINLTFDGEPLHNAQVQLFTGDGILVYEQYYAATAEAIDLTGLQPGIYFIKVIKDGVAYYNKFMLG